MVAVQVHPPGVGLLGNAVELAGSVAAAHQQPAAATPQLLVEVHERGPQEAQPAGVDMVGQDGVVEDEDRQHGVAGT